MSRFANNTLQSTLAGVSVVLAGLLSMVAMARLLGPGGAGQAALAIWICAIALAIADFGLPLTVSRFIPDLEARGGDEAAQNFASAFFRPFAASTLAGAIFFFALFIFDASLRTYFTALPFGDGARAVWLAIATLFTLQALGNYGLAEMRGRQRFALAARVSLFSLFAQVGGVCAGAYYFGVWGALIGVCAGSATFALYTFPNLKTTAGIDPSLRARAWRFSLSSWSVGLIAAIVWSRTELAFLSVWRSAHEAGLYSVAATVAQVATQTPLMMTGALLALFSERHARSDETGLQLAYSASMRFMALIIFPIGFGMAAIAPVLVPLVFGHAFDGAVNASVWLLVAQSFSALTAVTTALLFARERNRFLVETGFIGVVAIMLAGLLVIPTFGLMGAVASRALVQVATTGATFLYLERVLATRTPYEALARIIPAAAICALAARLIISAEPNAFGLAGAIVLGALFYCTAIILLKPLPAADVVRLRDAAMRTPSWVRALLAPAFRLLSP